MSARDGQAAINEPDLGASIFACLPGVWSLERQIQRFGSMAGTAVFAPDHTGALRYREEVVVTTSQGASFDGVREYLYRLSHGDIVLRFADAHRLGSEYVRLAFVEDLGVPKAVGIHYCGQDIYTHTMIWMDDNRFTTEIAVEGPKKDYLLSTDYRRSAAP